MLYDKDLDCFSVEKVQEYPDENEIIKNALELPLGCFNVSEERVVFKFWLDGYTFFYLDGDKSVRIKTTYDEFLSFCRRGIPL